MYGFLLVQYGGVEFHTFNMVGEKTEENETDFCLSPKRNCKKKKKVVEELASDQ